MNTSTTTHKGLDLLFTDIIENLPVPMFLLGTNSMNHPMSIFLFLQNLTSMIMVSLSLPIVQEPLYLGLFFIGHTLTIFTSLKIDIV